MWGHPKEKEYTERNKIDFIFIFVPVTKKNLKLVTEVFLGIVG